MIAQDGKYINLPLVEPILNVDTYDVSMQAGYNISATIQPTSNFKSDSTNTCGNPVWFSNITQTDCPVELQYIVNGNYIGCMTACNADIPGPPGPQGDFCCSEFPCADSSADFNCQMFWDNQAYYTTFATACPDCLITNCDRPNYTCNSSSNRDLSNYTITLCPNLSTPP